MTKIIEDTVMPREIYAFDIGNLYIAVDKLKIGGLVEVFNSGIKVKSNPKIYIGYSEHQAVLDEKDTAIQELNDVLRSKDARIKQLESLLNECAQDKKDLLLNACVDEECANESISKYTQALAGKGGAE